MVKTVPHDDAMVRIIKDDPTFASVYLHQAFVEIDEEGGYEAFILVLRHVIEATGGIEALSKRTGISSDYIEQSLSPKGDIPFKLVLELAYATGFPISRIASANLNKTINPQ